MDKNVNIIAWSLIITGVIVFFSSFYLAKDLWKSGGILWLLGGIMLILNSSFKSK